MAQYNHDKQKPKTTTKGRAASLDRQISRRAKKKGWSESKALGESFGKTDRLAMSSGVAARSTTAKREANRKATLKRGPVKRPKKKPTSFRDMKF